MSVHDHSNEAKNVTLDKINEVRKEAVKLKVLDLWDEEFDSAKARMELADAAQLATLRTFPVDTLTYLQSKSSREKKLLAKGKPTMSHRPFSFEKLTSVKDS